jgi:adenosylcobinamide kinase/adenosylcobinamide-phosphate guanylyltransferase
MSHKIIFITGGARSGKSSFALNEASKINGQMAYIATAEALDSEMKKRIEKHKKDRGDKWDTYEESLKIPDTLSDIKNKYSVVVLDCLTLWLSNLMHKSIQVEDNINEFINILASLSRSNRLNRLNDFNGLNLFVVSNEVGMGIVPDNEVARKFRDIAGLLNQKVAEKADEVYLVTAGIPMRIK